MLFISRQSRSGMANVLVVDDDADFCESLVRYLSALGHAVSCESDGRSALKKVMHSNFDAILLDLRMPVMDGLAFLSVVRSYIRFKHTPILVMTGIDDDAVLSEVEGFGVAQILRKGQFEFADIRRAIEQIEKD